MSKFLLGFLLGGLVALIILRRAEREEEWEDAADELASATQEAPPLRHSVIDPRLDQRLPTMAKPPEQPPPPTEEEM